MKAYITLFLSLAYIGALTFGGGYSMLPMIHRELVDKKQWLTKAEVADIFSVGQCLPGIIACNAAVFVGCRHKGTLGGVVAALGVALPSVVVITVIATFFTGFADYPVVQSAMVGVRVCVSALIVNVVIKLWKHSIADTLAAIAFLAVFFASVLTSLPVAALVIAAGAYGIAVSTLRRPKREGGRR